VDSYPQCPRRIFCKWLIGVKIPDPGAHTLLRGTLQVGAGIQLVDQPFGVHSAQRMAPHLELPGIIAQYNGIAQEVVRVTAAPWSSFRRDLHRIRHRGQGGEAKPVQMG